MEKILMKKILMKRNIFFVYIKMVNNYYEKHKERLQKEPREWYQNLSEEEKDKRRKKARQRYQNFTEEEKEKRHQYYLERYLNVLLYTLRRDIICETFAEFIFMFLYPRACVLWKKNCKLCPVSVFFLWKLLCLFLKVLEILMFNNFDSFITLAFS